MDLGIIALVCAVIFVAELPDKSLFASLVMGRRYPSRYVWFGTAAAFLVHVIIAVSAGALLTLLPHKTVEIIVGILFLSGAGLVFSGKHGAPEHDETVKLTSKQAHNPWKVFATVFSVVFIGEWGDITQIATANYAAKYQDPISVGIGAVLGLWAVSALAVFVGTKLLDRIHPRVVQNFTGFILLGFGVYSLITAFR